MINYLFLLGSVLMVVLIGAALYAKFIAKDSIWWTIIEKRKILLYVFLVLALFVSILVRENLYNTVQCSFKGYITNTERQYSWYMKECQTRTDKGSYINADRNVGLPDSKGEQHGELPQENLQ